MRVGPRLGLAMLLAAICSLPSPSASADAAAEARFFDRVARSELAAHHYDRALALFLQSHRAAPSPGALYNVAIAAQLAHQDALAYAHFEEFLASDTSDAIRREDAARRMTQMEARLCRVRVESVPPGATITVDREDLGVLGRTPRTIVVDPGPHEVHLRLAGRVPASVEVEAAVGRLVEASRSLEPVFGTLELGLSPESARVTARAMDGSEVVVAGSDRLRVPVGRHSLRIEAPGHVTAEREVTITETPTRLRIALAPTPERVGRVLVDTGAVTARVLVDGAPRTLTPARLSLDVGVHTLRVEADGYRPWEGEVDIAEERARYVDLVLVPER